MREQIDQCRLLIVDDHPLVRQGLKTILESQQDFELVGEAESCSAALSVLEELTPDILLLDIQLPDGNGFELTQLLRERYPALRILLISAQDEQLYGGWSLQFGADGMINKSAEPEEICALIRQAWRGEPALSETTRRWALQLLRGEISEGTHRLTAREFSVFFQIGWGYNSKEIAEQLSISPRTVETYHRKIREKLALPHHDALVRLAAHLFSGGETRHQIESESQLLRDFETRTLQQNEWTHEAHLVVAFQYLSRYPYARALKQIQSGIKRLNESHGEPQAYHETVTLAFAQLIKARLDQSPVWLHARDFLDHNQALWRGGMSGALTPYYSEALLKDPDARSAFIEPDLQPLPNVSS